MTTDFDKLVLDEMPDGIVIITPEGTVVYWNNGAESLFGYTEAEALQHPLDELVGTSAIRGRLKVISRVFCELAFPCKKHCSGKRTAH